MMNHEMARYDAYKDSGVEWLGDVPKHWEVSHLKRFCTKITDGAHTSPDLSSNDYPFLTVVNLEKGILDFEGCLFTSCVDYEKLVRNGCQPKKYDVLYSKDGTISETAVIHEDRYFVVGSSFIIIRPHKKMSNSVYLYYVLASSIMLYQARIYVKGASLPRISIFNITKLISVLPPIHEQKAIADYLDTKTTHIDRKIDLLTQKATQYGKLKQSLINETVTRGLDKNVAMKDSGVDWIGEVPKHWEVKRLKNLAYIKTGGKDTIDNVEDGSYPFFVRSQTIERINSYSFDGEAILTAGDGVGVGKVFHYVNEKFDYHQRVYKISHFKGVIGKFIFYYMRENFHKDALRLNAKSTVDSLRMPMFQNFSIAFGNIEEQQRIVDYLDTKTAHIDRIIDTINTQINKLKELRKTLINDVVTGKIRVAMKGEAV